MPRSTRARTCSSRRFEQDLGISVNHYVAVGFPGFSGMVDALGGVTMDFPTEVKDQYTGLDITTTGCQSVNGTVALQLVRSRHLYYMDQYGSWQYDGQSDFSRIQRQDAFFRAVLAKVNTLSLTNPLAVNSFVSAAVGNLTIDDTLSEGDLLHLAQQFKGLSSSHLITETLPTTGFVTDGGAEVLQEAQPYAYEMIAAFKQLGMPRAQAGTHDHHDRSGRTAQPDQRASPQRLDHQRSGARHRDRAGAAGLQDRRDRGRDLAADVGHLRDPVRTGRAGGGAHARGGPERTADLHGGAGTERADGDAPRGRAPAHRDPLGAASATATTTTARRGPRVRIHVHHDDHPRRRRHEHPARALEPLPLHAGPDPPGDTDEADRERGEDAEDLEDLDDLVTSRTKAGPAKGGSAGGVPHPGRGRRRGRGGHRTGTPLRQLPGSDEPA